MNILLALRLYGPISLVDFAAKLGQPTVRVDWQLWTLEGVGLAPHAGHRCVVRHGEGAGLRRPPRGERVGGVAGRGKRVRWEGKLMAVLAECEHCHDTGLCLCCSGSGCTHCHDTGECPWCEAGPFVVARVPLPGHRELFEGGGA